jgi:hypothetical protein
MTQQKKADISSVTYRELLQHNVSWQNSIKTLRAGTRITLDSPNFAGKFDAKILMGGKDSLLITVTGPFGMQLGKVFLSENRFLFYNQLMNKFFTGSKHDFKGQNFLQFPVEIGQIRNVFIAQDKFDVLKMARFEVRDNKYYLEAENGKAAYNIWFDPSHLLITRIEYLNDGELLFYKEYKDFREASDTYFPHHINFVRPATREGLSIYFASLQLNEAFEKGAFNIRVSDSASQIDLSLQNQN